MEETHGGRGEWRWDLEGLAMEALRKGDREKEWEMVFVLRWEKEKEWERGVLARREKKIIKILNTKQQ